MRLSRVSRARHAVAAAPVHAPAAAKLDAVEEATPGGAAPAVCAWCGRPVADVPAGRRRRYCRQSCRQRAYEQRRGLAGTGVPEGAVVLAPADAAALADRAFRLRCACEDVATAVAERAEYDELADLCRGLVALARDAERLR